MIVNDSAKRAFRVPALLDTGSTLTLFGTQHRVVFSPAADGMSLPLLGFTGFFEHFDVRFKGAHKKFRVTLR